MAFFSTCAVPAGVVTKAVPDKILDVRQASGATRLVVRFKKLSKMGIFDIEEAKFVEYVPLQTRKEKIATGGDTLVIHDPDAGRFSVWNTKTGTQVKTATLRLPGKFLAIGMAFEDSSSVFIIHFKEHRMLYILLDLRTMKAVRFDPVWDARPRYVSPMSTIWLSDRMSHVLMYTRGSNLTLLHGRISGGKLNLAAGAERGKRPVLLSGDGMRIYNTAGGMIDASLKKVERYGDRPTFPVWGTDHFLVLESAVARSKSNSKPVFVAVDKNNRALHRFECLATIPSHAPLYTLEYPEVWASGPLDKMAVVNSKSKEIAVFDMGLSGKVPSDEVYTVAAAPAGKQTGPAAVPKPTGVQPGALWTMDLNLKQGSAVRVEDGPAECRYEPATGLLKWQVPRDAATGTAEILLSIRQPKAREEWRQITVEVK